MTATASSRKNASRRWLRLLSLSIFATSTSSGLRTVQLVPGLRAADFQHPMDRDAAGARQLLKPLENAVRRGFSTIEDTYAMDNIASGVLVGPNQLPEYHEMTVEACKILNIDQVPQLYIRQSSAPNAYTLAVQGRAPFVVLTTRLLDLLEPLEVQAVIAHELGHLKCEHGLPIAVANILGSVLVPDALSGVAQSRLLRWQRTTRLRNRVVSAFTGVTSRTDATRQLVHGMRKVVSLVHDSSLTVQLSFEGISYKLRDGTSILSDASGTVSADEITVLMGPSGCGKSTLLNLLSGKLQPHRGTICLNGKPGSVRDLHKLIAFVPQDDVMLGSLTVMEVGSRAAPRVPVPVPVPVQELLPKYAKDPPPTLLTAAATSPPPPLSSLHFYSLTSPPLPLAFLAAALVLGGYAPAPRPASAAARGVDPYGDRPAGPDSAAAHGRRRRLAPRALRGPAQARQRRPRARGRPFSNLPR